MWETQVRFLGREDPLEKEMAILSSSLAWKIPWMEEPDRLQSTGSQRVGHDWTTSLSLSPFQGIACRSWCRYVFSSPLGPTVIRKQADSLPQCRWAEAPWPQQHLPSGREALTPIGSLSPSEVKAWFSTSPHQWLVPPPTTSFYLVYAGWGRRLGSLWALTGTEDKESTSGKREKAISLSARSSLSVVLLWFRWRLRSPQDPTDSTLLGELRFTCFSLQGMTMNSSLGQQYPSRGMECNLLLLGRHQYSLLSPVDTTGLREGRELESHHPCFHMGLYRRLPPLPSYWNHWIRREVWQWHSFH